MPAKFVVLNLRTIVMLEERHDDKMNFRPADMDEALDVVANDLEPNEDSESA